MKLEIIKGYDKNDKAFSAFVLHEGDITNYTTNTDGTIDLTLSNVLYTIPGHTVSEELLKNVTSYLKNHYIPKLKMQSDPL